MFASEEELGWDITMKRLKANPDVMDITVRSADGAESVFRTVKILSDFRADALLGRGTRVWEVVRVMNGKTYGKHLALKDVWIEADRPREGDILSTLRMSDQPGELQNVFNKFFLTVACHGDVFVLDRGGRLQPDDTRAVMMRGHDLPEDAQVFNLLLPPPPNKRSDPSKTVTGYHRGLGITRVVPKTPIRVHPKRHYRIVFNEVCKAVHDETSLEVIFNVLGQACYGTAYILMSDLPY